MRHGVGLRERLLSPEAAAAYVREYHRAYEAEAAAAAAIRRPTEKRLAELARAIERAVVVLTQRLKAMETGQDELKAELAALDAESPAPVTPHPRAGEIYSRRVAQLQSLLEDKRQSEEPADQELLESVRALIRRIEIWRAFFRKTRPSMLGDVWWLEAGSNRRPVGYESTALTI